MTSLVSSTRTQLTVDELRQVRWLLGGVLTLLAVSTVAYMDVDAWAMLTATAVVSLVTTLWPTLPARVPRFAHVLAFPLIVGFFTLDLLLKSELLPAMVRLDMLLLLYRAMVYRQRRDDLQLIVLGLFLVVVAGVLTVSLAFAVQILVYTACALLFLLVLNLSENGAGAKAPEPAEKAAGSAAAPPAWAAHVKWAQLARRVAMATDWRVMALGGALFLGVIAGTAVLFMAIPRFQLENGMFLDRFITKKARTGFTDTIRFGDVTEIQQDNSVALHVDPPDPKRIPASPYWRMLVLNEYVNGTFRLSADLRATQFSGARTGVVVSGRVPFRREAPTWTFYLEPGVSRYVPLAGPFSQLRFSEAQTHQSAREMALIALSKDPVTMIGYQVQGLDPTRRIADNPASYYADRTIAGRRVSALTPPEIDLLERWAREASGGELQRAPEFAERVCAWLRERHPYSLSPRIPDGRGDPLVRWAGSHEAGHCELFAGSFVLLARAAGFPARVVTGFRGGTWNAYSNSFTIRNSDAHAWAEIFDPASGAWIRADPLELPTAAHATQGGGEAALAQRTDRSWSARLDSLRVAWYRRVVSFDQETQVNTVKAAKEATQAMVARLRAEIERGALAVKRWWQSPWDFARGGRLAGVFMSALLLTWLWRRLRVSFLRWRFRAGGERRVDPIRREAGRWLRRAESLGVDAGDVRLDLQRLRFGAPSSWPEPELVFRRARIAMRGVRRR